MCVSGFFVRCFVRFEETDLSGLSLSFAVSLSLALCLSGPVFCPKSDCPVPCRVFRLFCPPCCPVLLVRIVRSPSHKLALFCPVFCFVRSGLPGRTGLSGPLFSSVPSELSCFVRSFVRSGLPGRNGLSDSVFLYRPCVLCCLVRRFVRSSSRC